MYRFYAVVCALLLSLPLHLCFASLPPPPQISVAGAGAGAAAAVASSPLPSRAIESKWTVDDFLDEVTSTSASRPLAMKFNPLRSHLWRRFRGTVLQKTWKVREEEEVEGEEH